MLRWNKIIIYNYNDNVLLINIVCTVLRILHKAHAIAYVTIKKNNQVQENKYRE